MKIEIEEKELRKLEGLEFANLKLIQEQRRFESFLKEFNIDKERLEELQSYEIRYTELKQEMDRLKKGDIK